MRINYVNKKIGSQSLVFVSLADPSTWKHFMRDQRPEVNRQVVDAYLKAGTFQLRRRKDGKVWSVIASDVRPTNDLGFLVNNPVPDIGDEVDFEDLGKKPEAEAKKPEPVSVDRKDSWPEPKKAEPLKPSTERKNEPSFEALIHVRHMQMQCDGQEEPVVVGVLMEGEKILQIKSIQTKKDWEKSK